ncbi:MAG: hypothetical protein K6G12_04055 [Lachnospiraceae bacterium]|nr:hypothetical protein [Lachnospiraceae bacterium]
MSEQIYKIHMGKARLALDLSDGSERGEYVDQDYILHTLGRPHRNINLMYTYYPKDEQWPARISEACKDMEVNFAWDYPYDDYFPYGAGDEPFKSMKDVRRHGQDVTLTITIDCSLDDDTLRAFARDLRPYGRMRLRINHECCGDWFTHNKRFSYKEIADFFVRFTAIIKEEAPNVKVIFCAGFAEEDGGKVACEDVFIEAYKAADVWSADRYLALNYGWPYDVSEKDDGGRHTFTPTETCFNHCKYTSARLKAITGQDKPFVMSELNADGDVVGPMHQGEVVKRFTDRLKADGGDWFEAYTFYQFRDRGRLGLEIEDPNNPNAGIAQPILKEYKDILNDPYCMPKMDIGETVKLPFTFRWGGSEDADGLGMKIRFDKNPEFCEMNFEENLSLMIEFNGHWFYKSPETKFVDLMPAFFENPIEDGTELELKLFATPAEGINPDNGKDDWAINYYATMTKIPDIRIRYEPVSIVD